jgi:mannose-6-phosphate isomerase-like protein (cupin superfamily)
MKIVRKNQTKKYKNSDVCSAIEFPLGDKDINGAVIKLNGRYPEKDKVVNLKCKELAYIIQGSGKIVFGNTEIKFNEGDLLLIEPGEAYYWVGDCEMFVPCAPAWYPEQHKEVE